ncbi:MAG: V-type ATPase subunit [Nitrospirae bacterium]|nr:V-type ATPase subunit [Nitrospirota bacterium]
MDDYSYLNARIRSMRSELLGETVYETLVAASGLTGFGETLKKTRYEKILQYALENFSLSVFEEKLREEWLRVVNKIYAMMDGVPKNHLDALLCRWEAENLKTIIRGKKNHIGEPEILSVLLPAGALQQSLLAELVRQPSIEALIDLLAVWRSPFAKPLKKALKTGQELKRLESLERSLDIASFEEAFKKTAEEDSNARMLRSLLEISVDRTNLLTAYKIFYERGVELPDESFYFIRGGKGLTLKVYQALSRAKNRSDFKDILQKTPYASVLNEEGIDLERGLDRFMLKKTRRMGIADPLGIGVMADYFFRKTHELTNLRVIARAKSYGMYPADIRTLLVM